MSKLADINSIDEILEKIKKAINEDTKKINIQKTQNHTHNTNTDQEVLELTNVVSNNSEKNSENLKDTNGKNNLDAVSKYIKNFTHKLNILTRSNSIISEKEVREIFKETLRPYLKSWLNNNLENIVKEIVTIEVKKILKKII